MYQRSEYQTLASRLKEPRKFIQVVMGPRQVGKTTLVRQVVSTLSFPSKIESADNVASTQNQWIATVWNEARNRVRIERLERFVLVIDEIQKISNWSEAVKHEWDYDTWHEVPIVVVLLGSSRVMLERGLSESLMGRFEEIRMTHWSYEEMHDAFGFSLSDYIYFGSYPAAADFIADATRWEQYIGGAIIDATINKDILMNSPIGKPALLRQTFELGCSYSGELLSLTKMVGSLQDAGNTTTLTGYLNLLSDSGLLCALQKFSFDASRRRASVPKFQVFNNALYSFNRPLEKEAAMADSRLWGRYVESAVGAHLVSRSFAEGYHVYYWREGNREVDFVLEYKGRIALIEVKSNAERTNAGLEYLREHYHPHFSCIVGEGGIPLETFLRHSPKEYLV